MQHFKLFAKSLQLSTLDTCYSLILLLQRIPYIFRRIFLQDGFQYRLINGLEHIVLGLKIFQLLIFICLLLYLTKIWSFCCSSDPCLYQVPIFFGSLSAYSNGHSDHQTLEWQVARNYSQMPCLWLFTLILESQVLIKPRVEALIPYVKIKR